MSGSARGYRLSPRAQIHLEEIWLYTFETWSVEQADRYQNAIVATIDALACGSKTGRSVALRDGYFKCATGSHVIFYRQTASGLDVIRVLHQRMVALSHL